MKLCFTPKGNPKKQAADLHINITPASLQKNMKNIIWEIIWEKRYSRI